jgi:UDP-glucose 4-epimerase
MDFTYVTDIVEGIVRASESNEALNKVINLASGRDFSINELADFLLTRLGKKGEIQPIYDKPRPHENMVTEEVASPIVSISKAERLIRYKPEVPFEVGVQDCIDQYRLKQAC